MHRFIRPGRGALTLIAGCIAVAVAGGVSYAATSGFAGNAHSASGRTLYACVTARFKTLNLSSAGATCPNGQQKISWNIKGERGPLGSRGPRGHVGSHGLTGDTGATGPPGPQGTKGDIGAAGAAGPPGPRGPQGLPGAKGDAGSPGANGASVASTSLPSGDSNCPNGGSGFTAASGTTYACNGASGVPGPGFQFTTTSGAAGPTLNQTGTYFVVVEAGVDGGVANGNCNVSWGKSTSGGAIGGITGVGGAYLPGSHGYSFAGMLTGLPAGAGLGLFCASSVGPVTPSNVQWWVSPIGS
jgi:hypothetical protein